MRFIIRYRDWSLIFQFTRRILPYYHSWKSNKKPRIVGYVRSYHKNWKFMFISVSYRVSRREK